MRAQGALWCDSLGAGTHAVQAYSVVGRTDSRNNWCDPDDHIGNLTCEASCDCPEGFTYDPSINMCRGTCGDVPVTAFPLGCGWAHSWH